MYLQYISYDLLLKNSGSFGYTVLLLLSVVLVHLFDVKY